MEFAKVSDIKIGDPATWRDRVFLTFDLDWASDSVLEHTIQILESHGVPATFFVTHDTTLISRLRASPQFELGIHPNFNALLLDEPVRDKKNARDIVAQLLKTVPEAVSVRSHSLMHSTHLVHVFYSLGLRYDLNFMIPFDAGIELNPWLCHSGMIRVPHYWEDDVASHAEDLVPVKALLNRQGLRVFDFHPIHLALNTRELSLYERTRAHHGDFKKLEQLKEKGYGTKNFLSDLIDEVKSNGKTG